MNGLVLAGTVFFGYTTCEWFAAPGRNTSPCGRNSAHETELLEQWNAAISS